jgi:biotin carboxylase
MTERPVIIAGFVLASLATLAEFQDEQTVIFVEEPDVARKRDVPGKVDGSPLVRALIEWEYQLPGAADAFFAAHPDLNPEAVVALTEYATPFAARLAERYGLPGAGHGAALVLRDKASLRRVTAAAGIANTESVTVESPGDVRAFQAVHPGKVVLKPSNRQASVGTMVLSPGMDLDAAWAECTVQDEGVFVPDRPMPLTMLAERFVSGTEYSVELLVADGETLFANVTGKLLHHGPRPIELGHIVPAICSDEVTELLCERTRAVLAAVGFGFGVLHCEWIISDGVPYLVECAGRFAGDGIVVLIERAYPVALVRDFYTVMKDRRPDPMPVRATRGAVVRFLAAEPGVVEGLDGVADAESVAGVQMCDVTVAVGDEVHELRSSWDRVGDVLTVADSPEAALASAEEAIAHIQLTIRPRT